MPSDTSNNSATLYLQTQSASANAGADGALTDNNGVRLKLASQPGGSGPNSAFTVEVGSAERLRIESDGDIKFGTQGSSVANNSTALTHIDAGREYWSGTAGDYRALKHRLYYANTDDAYGMGISNSLLEIQSQTAIGFFAGSAGAASGRRVQRLRITNNGNIVTQGLTDKHLAMMVMQKF